MEKKLSNIENTFCGIDLLYKHTVKTNVYILLISSLFFTWLPTLLFSHTYKEDHQLVGVKEPGKNGGNFLGPKVSTSIARTLIPFMRDLPL